MNINELDSFNLADAVKFNEELNPRIWQGSRMRPEVRRKLLAIAKDFKQSLGLSDLEVKDITLSGSNAGYTYTPHSDIDLHLVVDMPQAETDEVYRELFNAKKYQYNDEHNLAIGGYPVELYVENANTPPVSQGMFSVLANDWINIPRKRKSTVNDDAVKSKYELMKHRIESTIDSGDIKRLTRTAARIKQIRQAGLDKNGELGPENLAYKMLRTQGLIEKLYAARTAAKDQQLSLQERKKKKKSRVRYGFGGYWAPGFSFGSEGGGDGGGGGESVREDATISPYGVNPTTQMFLNETGDAEQTVRDFIEHAADRLGIERIPEIKLHSDLEWSQREHSFGRYTPDTHTLEVSLANRHVMDILRTVAHELVHCRQHELSPLPDEAGETGSRWENEAHAKAGVLMRDYADAHPNRFGEHALAEASGYIPTKAQARDPRFSTALTVDVHPGQTGKEANKMALQTDAQGKPALLMKGLANQLHEEFAQFDESTALFEIKMTGKNLRAEAAKTGAIAGMEFEMIVPNVEGDDDDAEQEPDYDMDEGVNSISDAADFFENDGNNSPGDIRRLRESMQEEYWEWLGEQFDSRWQSDEDSFVYDYLRENASPEDIAEILGTEPNENGEYPDPDRQAYIDASEKIIGEGYGNYWYDQARESAQEDFNQSADEESEWLSDRDINSMRDVMDNFGNVNWPYWNTPSNGGDNSIEDVANDFQDAIGRDVRASGGYHSSSVDRPSSSSQHYVVEPDGSLEGDDYGDKGLEFVSPPLPIDVILNDLNKVKRWAKAYGCYTNDSTGLHINISVPNYSRDNLDFVKLAILMGDEYVSESFGRLGAFYAKSAMGMIRDNIRSRPEAVAQTLEKMKTHLDTAASKAIHSGVTTKYTSINVKDGHIEFRSPGGDWLDENFDKIENTLLRFTVALSAATNPEMYREEYLKKLYKLLNPEGLKDEYGDMIQEFSKYMTSLQGNGKEAGGKLSKETQQAIKDFRKVAAQELKQKNLANKLKKGDTGGQRYWWNVSWGNGRVEVVATTKEEAIDKAFNESYWAPDEPDTPQAIQFRGSLRAKPLSPYYEKSKPSVWKVYGSNSSPYQRLGTEVVATDEFEAMQKARQKWNLNVGGRTEEEFFSTNGWSAERIGDAPAEQTTKYEIYNKQTGNLVEPADGITNDADALVRLNDYIEHGPHALQRGQASRMFGIRTTSGVEIVDIDIPMAQGRAATSVTGQWKVVDGLNRELYRFRPAENTRAKANELAALWARENNFDGNYQVEPAEDTAPALTPDQRQGGLIDVAGSTTDLARQRATPGTFTGAWRVLDADGNELYRFSGVGNVQSDANRVAVQWMRSNGYDQSTDISVVPVMSESIAEGLNEFAPGGTGGGDSGRWYTDDELADIIGDDWLEDFDVSHDEFNIDTHGEKAKQNLASYANSWFDDKGYNVNVLGVDHNEVDHNLKWYIVGSFHNPRFANEGMAESMPQPSQGQGKYRDLNAPLGPETPPQMPAGTTKVDVSDTQDWYQLGMDISNISAAKPEEYNQGPPHTVIVFPSDEFEQPYLKQFKRLGLKTHDIDPEGEEDIDEASLSTMRDFFAGDNSQSAKKNSQQTQIQKVFRSPEEYTQWAKQNKIVNAPRINEEPEFFSMPLRMSEYRGKHHPATKQPYDGKFKFSGDLKDRVHSLLDAGTKPTLLQVNPRHLLATQDWLSTQGGGKPPFATMKQHPVVLQKNNKLYILDGHHRSADALKSGTPIEVYLFRDEL
jgi:hypothetical protein